MVPQQQQPNQNYIQQVEEAVDWNTFDEQRKQFQRNGQGLGPDGNAIVLGTYGHNTVVERTSEEDLDQDTSPAKKKKKLKRKKGQQQQHRAEEEVTHGI